MIYVGITVFPFWFQGEQVILFFPQQASSLAGNHLKSAFYIYLYINLSNGDFVEFYETQGKIAGQKQEHEKHK